MNESQFSELPPSEQSGPDTPPGEPDPFIRGLWYVAMPGRHLARGKVVGRTLLGEPLLFARRTDRSVFALKDLCPHRGMPLRFGAFDGTTVTCGYHGWEFDGAGRCVGIPALTDEQPINASRIRCGAYPCVERHGLVWVFMPDPAVAADAHPAPAELCADFGDEAPNAAISLVYKSDFDNAAFGLMDPVHVPFVHSAWWMRRSRAVLRVKDKLYEPVGAGWRMAPHRIDKLTPFHRLLGRDIETEIEIRLPGLRIERIWGERHRILNLLAITPIDSEHTQMIQSIWWSMPALDFMAPVVRLAARRFLSQDREISVKQSIGLASHPRQMLVGDADAQMRWWLRLKREWRAHRHEDRAFRNPVTATNLRYRS